MTSYLSWSLLSFMEGLHVHFVLQMGQFGAHELHYTLIFFFSAMMLLCYKKDKEA